MKFIKKIAGIYRPFLWNMVGTFAFIAISQALGLIPPYIQGKAVDWLATGKPLSWLNWLVVVTAVVSLLKYGGINFFRERHELTKIDYVVSEYINRITLERIFQFSISQHVNENSGIKRSIITRGQHSLSTLVYSTLYQIVPIMMEVSMLIGLLFYHSWILGMIVFSTVTSFATIAILSNSKFGKDFRKMNRLQRKNDKFQGENLELAAFVLTNAQEAKAVRECNDDLQKLQAFALGICLRFNVHAILRNVVLAIGSATFFLATVTLVRNKHFTIGQMLMFLSWSATALNQASNVGWMHRNLAQLYVSVRKYFEMLEIEPDVKVVENPVSPDKFKGRIEFRNVSLWYKSRDVKDEEDDEEQNQVKTFQEPQLALKDVSFTIEAGQRVALVGESGAGKSTIVYALLRAQDVNKGQVLIDGHDLRILDLKHYRESIGVVEQFVPLFDDSIRYNITYGLNGRAKDVTEEDLHHIAEMSAIDKFYPKLENGFDTLIGERGIKLSGGERQRVGIARALIKEPDILVFDEATSSLDAENESIIRESIHRASEGRTTIIIAHRFCTIKDVDKILVFDKGELIGQGTHVELYESCETYRRLVQRQVF